MVLVTGYTMGGCIHILLLIAVVVVVMRAIRGQNVFAAKM